MSKLTKAIGLAAFGVASYAAGKIIGTCYGAGLVCLAQKKNPEQLSEATNDALTGISLFMGKEKWDKVLEKNPWMAVEPSQDEETEESPITVTTNAEPETEEADDQPED